MNNLPKKNLEDIEITEELRQIWMWKYILGTLSSKKVDLLQEDIIKRHVDKKTRTRLELLLAEAFAVERPTRKHLGELLNQLEKRIIDC